MARRIWIIAKKEEVEPSDIADAKANNCPEVANGIPPNLKDVVDEGSLPIAYEEPEPEPPEPPRDLAAEMDEVKDKIADYDDLKARVKELEKK